MSAPFKERPPSAEPFGERGSSADATAAARAWLVDQHGRLQAADGALAESIAHDPRLRAAIQRVLDHDVELSIDLAIADDSYQSPTRARIRRLVGQDGPLALVEILNHSPAPANERLDPLTGLADRNALQACVDDWRRSAVKRPVRFALLFLDLDGFKQINDRHGHAAGDRVLKTLASRWLACVRDGDLVARYGGDEFVVLVNEATSAEDIGTVVRRLRQATELPLDVAGAPTNVSVTIGVAICTSDDTSIDDLLAEADQDMYAQKRNSHYGPDNV